MWKILGSIGLTLLLLYSVYLSLLFIFQRSIIYPGQFRHPVSNEMGKAADSLINLALSFGRGYTYLVRPDTPSVISGAVMILAHGNNELSEECLEEASHYARLGCSVFVPEYPGYGNSDGEPMFDSIMEVFTATYDHLIQMDDFKNSPVIAYGRSLGGGTVCALAVNRKLRAVILQSTFSDIRRFSTQYLAPSFLVRDRFYNAKYLAAAHVPTLILHGRKDHLIPLNHAKRLFNAIPGSKLIAYECGHNDFPVWSRGHLAAIAKFLQEKGILPGTTTGPKPDPEVYR